MKYISPTQLPELTALADEAQLHLASLLDDYKTLPDPSLEYRLTVLDRITDFIYRLTAVRKTLVALRASTNPNLVGLRALSANIRAIHAQMLAFKDDISEEREFQTARDRLYDSPSPLAQRFPQSTPRSPNVASGRFAPNWSPTTDEIIPEPRLPHSANHVECAGSPALCPAELAPRQTADHSSIVDESAHSTSCGTAAPGSDLNSSNHSDPSHSSHSHSTHPSAIPSIQSTCPAELPSSSLILPPSSFPPPLDPLDSLAASINSRIPASISDPDFQLPSSSNRASDYAPLYDLDLVPHTPCVPTLPLSAPDLSDQLHAQLDQIKSGTADLHSSIHNLLRIDATHPAPAPSNASPTSLACPVPDNSGPLPGEPGNITPPPDFLNGDLKCQSYSDSASDPPFPDPQSLSP